jgi:outer membrane protein OmpA-like peptidoglycan-associated protein
VAAVQRPAQPGEPVLLCLRLKGEYRDLVRTDARVRIVGEGLVGGKVVEILPQRPRPGEDAAPPAANGAMLTAQPTVEATDQLEQASALLNGDGAVGRLLRDPRLYEAAVAALDQGKDALTSVRENSDGLQKTWLMRGLVQKPRTLLERFDCQRDRRVFAAADLFAADSAVLTAPGKAALDRIAGWLEGMKHPGSDVVVAAYADPRQEAKGLSAALAGDLTLKRSEAVCTYLKERHGAQRMGWLTTRPVTPLGLGYNPPPATEPEPLPPARVEVIVFVPQK